MSDPEEGLQKTAAILHIRMMLFEFRKKSGFTASGADFFGRKRTDSRMPASAAGRKGLSGCPDRRRAAPYWRCCAGGSAPFSAGRGTQLRLLGDARFRTQGSSGRPKRCGEAVSCAERRCFRLRRHPLRSRIGRRTARYPQKLRLRCRYGAFRNSGGTFLSRPSYQKGASSASGK